MQLTGSSAEDDLDRFSLAFFNKSVNFWDKQLIYAIATTPGYNVGKEVCFQDQYEFFVAQTTVLEAVSIPVPSVSPGSVSQVASDTGATDIGISRRRHSDRWGRKPRKERSAVWSHLLRHKPMWRLRFMISAR
jgi:hypothetical protein